MALKEMSTVLDAEREALELESIPEYLNESHLPSREAAVTMASKAFSEREIHPDFDQVSPSSHKADELETLWPGVHHEFGVSVSHPRKSPSFYVMAGFMAGAFISLGSVFAYFGFTQITSQPGAQKQITVASIPGKGALSPSSQQTTFSPTSSGGDVVMPVAPQYQVQPGDTLAAIAFKNYKRVSPRLLDEICKANGMRNANVLSLGQKLNLPDYRPQPTQVAGAGQVQ